MKWNKRVQNYLSEKGSKGRYFKLKNGKTLYLKRFVGQPKLWYDDNKKPSRDLKDAFLDLLTEAYQLGVRDGKDEHIRSLQNSLKALKELIKL